jgi:Ni,Fe-hydrogenase maturation factor
MLEEIQGAEYILFVDACLNELKEGVCWTKVEPELNGWAAGSHHLSPDLFLGLLELLYQCRSKAWMVSIEARCFELGESLQPATRQAGERAVLQIIEWLFANSIAFSTHFPVKSITKGAELWNTQMIS